jgi:hypothetical protein
VRCARPQASYADAERSQCRIAAHDFAPAARIVDVGGGTGALLATILQAYPQTSGVVFDLPAVAAEARVSCDRRAERMV